MNPIFVITGIEAIVNAIRRRRERKRRERHVEKTMGWLSETLASTNGKGGSKKFITLFVTGTLLPLLSSFGVNENIITMLAQLAAIYLGGQSVVDVGVALANGKKKKEE